MFRQPGYMIQPQGHMGLLRHGRPLSRQVEPHLRQINQQLRHIRPLSRMMRDVATEGREFYEETIRQEADPFQMLVLCRALCAHPEMLGKNARISALEKQPMIR